MPNTDRKDSWKPTSYRYSGCTHNSTNPAHDRDVSKSVLPRSMRAMYTQANIITARTTDGENPHSHA